MTSTTSTTQDLPAVLASMSAASLFVGELMPHVNEVLLYKKFAPMGTVTSVKLCRDWVTGKSLCYAYVNFENPAEAEKAYRTLNYELLEGQPMRIMKSTRNPWLQKSTDTCCYHHHCCNNGSSNNNTGGSLVDAKTLVEAIENYSMVFKSLAAQDSEVKAPTGYKYSSEFLKRMNNANKQYTNVFIKNFKDLLDDFKLWKLCKQFGEVTSAKVMVDEYGISKGFGFACFTDSDAAQRAVNKLNGLVLDGRTLYAGPAMTRTQRQRETGYRGDGDDYRNDRRPIFASPRICIRNLRDIVDDVRLRKEFERFGPVVSAELLKTPDGKSKGTGYVIYKDQSDATKALNSMHGKVIYGTRISVTYVPYTTSTATNTNTDNLFMDSLDGAISNKNNDDNDDSSHFKLHHHLHHPRSQDNIPTSTTGSGNTTTTSDDGDNNGSSFLRLKDLVSSLANKGHPVNINDISNLNCSNRNSSNNSGINTSNNAIRALTARKVTSELGFSLDRGAADERQHAKTTRNNSSMSTTSTTLTGNNNALTDKEEEEEEEAREEYCNDEEKNDATATLCVKNLDDSITDEKLESLFKVYGTVLSANVISNEFGKSKGFGFVIMADAQDAVRAIKNLDGRIVVNRPIYVAPTAQARVHPTAGVSE